MVRDERSDNMEIVTSLVRFNDFLSCISYLIKLKLINIRTIVVFKGVYGKYCSFEMLDSKVVRLILSGPFFHINLYSICCIVLHKSGDGFGRNVSRWLSFDKINVLIMVMRLRGA